MVKSIGRYEVVRRLGAGAGGVAYQARDTRLLRPVVLKVLRRGGASGEQLEKKLLREARLASAIEHPNVCSIYEVGDTDGQAFIAMQFVPGRTLEEMVAAGPLTLELALSVGIQIADGLAAAHALEIVHRDLKPTNVMLTDGGLVKILDFGLARHQTRDSTLARDWSLPRRASSRGGTAAYMAPEQFVTGTSSERSDIFALGVILYQMTTGFHPFRAPGAHQAQVVRDIQYREPDPLRRIRPELPVELESVVLKALAKNPAERFGSAAEVREALRTLVKALQIDAGLVPGATAALPRGGERRTGALSMLAERFMRMGSAPPPNSIAVLPFRNASPEEPSAFYGLALADAIAARLARLPSVVVRTQGSSTAPPEDLVRAGREMRVSHVLGGTYLRGGEGFSLSWQLLDVETRTLEKGGSIAVESLDLVAVQNEIAEQVFASLRGGGAAQPRSPAGGHAPLDGETSELYLEARALLSKFALRSSSREDLFKAQDKLASVLERRPGFAPAHSALGVAHLNFVRKGFGGRIHLMAAQKCFEAALERDPGLVEADLYGAYTFLARGEKESARHALHRLLTSAPNDFEVRIVAGVILRLDGLYDAALEQFGAALALDPARAVLIYDHRARLYHYQGQLELAMQEIQKGLVLEPRHLMLRTSLGYLEFRQGDVRRARETLEAVLAEHPDLPILTPTLGLCRLADGDGEAARALVTEEVLTAADADGEMAYRLATFFAYDGDAFEALHWLRKAIYLGNENHPWFAHNPAWSSLRGDEKLERILADLERTWRTRRRRWEPYLQSLGQGPV